jgi:ADP-ribose pyrophosphatase YjhB (NUDIX family)
MRLASADGGHELNQNWRPDPALRYCPRCASAMEARAIHYPEVLHPVCTACGFVLWQNRKLSVEALIARGQGNGTEVLLGRRVSNGRWDLPGNFLNGADLIEPALARECRREMGVDVQVAGILGAFEDMFLGEPIVSLVYLCSLRAGEPRPGDLIDHARWFSVAEPPEAAFDSVARSLAELKRRLNIP